MSAPFQPSPFMEDENPFGELFTWKWLTKFEKDTSVWTRTPQLQAIAATADAEEVSRWGLLMQVMQNRATHIDPTHVLVRRTGLPASDLAGGVSLSYYVLNVGDSGGGKSQVVTAASELVKPHYVGLPDGTGQGITKTFASSELVRKDENGELLPQPLQRTIFNQHIVHITADEVTTLNSEIRREGSKTSGFLCSMWIGATTGTLTGEKERRVILPANMYRLHATWGAQPENCDGIFERYLDGFPQRFVLTFVEDSRARSDVPPVAMPSGSPEQLFPHPVFNPGQNPFGTSLPIEFTQGDPLPIPTWITWNSSPALQKWVRDTFAARRAAREGIDPGQETEEQKRAIRETGMASHMVLTTIKTATVVAWLHGRCEPTDLDFEIALLIMEVSKRWSAVVWKKLADVAAKTNADLGTSRGQQRVAELEFLDARDVKLKKEIIDWCWMKLAAEGPKLKSQLQHGSDRKKKMIPAALNEECAKPNPRIFVDDGGMCYAVYNGTLITREHVQGASA